MGKTGTVKPGVQAAVVAASLFGLRSVDPVLVQETNNSVVWLRPHPVIAKVGTRKDSFDALTREFDVASALVKLHAPIAAPWSGSTPVRLGSHRCTVTFWNRMDDDRDVDEDAISIGLSLKGLQRDLDRCGRELPSVKEGLERTRSALFDDQGMAAMAAGDLEFLRSTFMHLRRQLDDRSLSERPLHGEPHAGNRLRTSSGIRWIDLEGVCRGPVEWDLAFLPEQAWTVFEDVDLALLGLVRALAQAQVATWCWAQARFPNMRVHGQRQLDALRDGRTPG